MSNIDPPAGWDDVDGINTNERLLGGPGGPLNRGLVGLAARTKQLRDWRDEDLDAVAADKTALAGTVGAALVGFQDGRLPQAGLTTLQARAQGFVILTDYAQFAVGNDWTEAFARAWADMTNPLVLRYAPQGNEPAWMVTKGPKLYIPEGYYQYNGPGLPMGAGQSSIFEIEGAGYQSVRLDITSDAWFIDATNAVVGFVVSGMQVYGGKGFMNLRNQAVTTNRIKSVRNMVFSEYTVCALANASQDAPYTRIENCMFRGRIDRETIGIAVCGFMAGSSIRGCVFQRNRYHIKLATAVIAGTDKGPSVPINISENDFLRYPSYPGNTYDVWFVPNLETSDNAGRAAVFFANKFGAESVRPGDAHVLVAQESDPANLATSFHTTTVGGFVNGVRFQSNNIGSVGEDATRIPFIKSFTAGIYSWDLDDIIDNGSPTFICEYDAAVAATSMTPQSNLNRYSARQDLQAAKGDVPAPITNLAGTWNLIDPLGFYNGQSGVVGTPGGGDLGGYLNILTPATTQSFASANVTRTAITNSIGVPSEASEVVMTAADGRIVGALTFANVVAGRQAFFEGELAGGSANSLDVVRVTLTDQAGRLVVRRILSLTDAWVRFRIPWIPNKTGITGLNVRIDSPSGYTAGTKTTFRVGRVAVYHGKEPVNTGHVQCLGTGAWNAPHIVLGGDLHIFRNGNDLRLSLGYPGSATAGVLLGTATA